MNPLFGQIIHLYLVGGDLLLFHLYQCQTSYFDDHFHSYVITETSSMSITSTENILDPWVLHGHKLFSDSHETYITLKHFFDQ